MDVKKRKILVTQPSGIGDCIQFLPLFKYIHTYNNVEIDILIKNKQLEDILIPTGFFRRIIYMPEVLTKDLIFNSKTKKIIKELKREQYDVALSTFPCRGIYSALLMKLCGIPVRAQHIYKFKVFEKTALFVTHFCEVERKHLIYNNYALFREAGVLPKGIDIKEESVWKVTSEVAGRTATLLKEYFVDINENSKTIGVYPGGNAEFKRWSNSNWLSVIEWIEKEHPGFKIFVFIGPDEKILLPIFKMYERENMKVVFDRSFTDILSLLNGMTLFIGNDGGLSHVYSLFNKPQITLFGATDYAYAYPINPNSEIVLPDKDAPIWVPYKLFIKPESENVLNTITAQKVIDKLDGVIKKVIIK